MEEILALQRELAAAQETNTLQRLSDRNCIELVMKLQSLNLITLIFTRSGKEYLTPKQLLLEIQDELLTRGGRLDLTELAESLNVSPTHIDNALPSILADQSIRLIRGQLITDDYLSSLIDEVNDALTTSASGLDSLGDIATRYSLPVDIARETLETNQTRLAAEYEIASGSLTSNATIVRYRARARGLLLGVTCATVLQEAATKRKIPFPLLSAVAREMVDEGYLAGLLHGRGNRLSFIPHVYTDAVAKTISTEFNSQGYITFAALARVHVHDVDVFVKQHLPGGCKLSQCVMTDVLLDTIVTSAVEVVNTGAWLDVEGALPTGFPVDDTQAVVDKTAAGLSQVQTLQQVQGNKDDTESKQKTGKTKRKTKTKNTNNKGGLKPCAMIYADRFIVSPQLVVQMEARVKSDAEMQARKHAILMAERMETTGSITTEIKTGPSNNTEKEETTKKGKAKGKGRRKAAVAAAKGQEFFLDGNVGILKNTMAIPSLEEVANMILEDKDTAQVLESDYLESSHECDDMVAKVLENVYGEVGLHALYEAKASEAMEALQREQAQMRQAVEKALVSGLLHAEMYNKYALSLPVDELVQSSRSWIMDTVVTDTVCRIVHTVAQNNGVSIAKVSEAHSLESKKDKLEVLRTTCAKLSTTIQDKARELINAVTKSNPKDTGDEGENDNDTSAIEQFLCSYDSAVDLLDLPERRPMDKKSERASVLNIRAQLNAKLDDANNMTATQVLKTATILSHARNCGGALVDFDNANAIAFAKAIEEHVTKPGELAAALRDLREAVESSASSASQKPDISQKLITLRQFIA